MNRHRQWVYRHCNILCFMFPTSESKMQHRLSKPLFSVRPLDNTKLIIPLHRDDTLRNKEVHSFVLVKTELELRKIIKTVNKYTYHRQELVVCKLHPINP